MHRFSSEMLTTTAPQRLMESPKHITALYRAFMTLCMLVFSPAVPGGGIGGGGKPGGGPGNGGGGGSPGGKLPGGGIPGGIALEGGRIPVGGWPSGCWGGGWYDITLKLIGKLVKLYQRKVCLESNMAVLVYNNQVYAGKPRFQYPELRWLIQSIKDFIYLQKLLSPKKIDHFRNFRHFSLTAFP